MTRIVALGLLSSLLFGCQLSLVGKHGCTSDRDCLNGRICEEQICVVRTQEGGDEPMQSEDDPGLEELDAQLSPDEDDDAGSEQDLDAEPAPDEAAAKCGTLEGSVTVQNALNLRALSGCTAISGDLTITGVGLTSLAGLESLTTVGGNLRIYQATKLASLSGLSGLRSVGGLSISNNPALTSLAGLDGLTKITHLSIESNEGLTDLQGLGAAAASGAVSIQGNISLTSLNGWAPPASMQSLAIGGNALATASLPVQTLTESLVVDEAQLKSLSLPELTSIGGRVYLGGKGAETNYGVDMPALASIGGELVIAHLRITSFVAPLLRVKGYLSIEDVSGGLTLPVLSVGAHVALKEITGGVRLPALLSVGGDLEVERVAEGIRLPALTSVAGRVAVQLSTEAVVLPALASAKSVWIRGNAQLSEFDLGALEVVDGDVSFIRNTWRMPLSLSSLRSVGGTLLIEEDHSLSGVLDIGALTTVLSLRLERSSITSLTANHLATAGSIILRYENPKLASISFRALTQTSSISINSFPAIATVDFNALTSLTGDLEIFNNPELTGIGFGSLTSVGGRVAVSENGRLSQCHVRTLFTQLSRSCMETWQNTSRDCYPNGPTDGCP